MIYETLNCKDLDHILGFTFNSCVILPLQIASLLAAYSARETDKNSGFFTIKKASNGWTIHPLKEYPDLRNAASGVSVFCVCSMSYCFYFFCVTYCRYTFVVTYIQ